jgi:hypothetical protein
VTKCELNHDTGGRTIGSAVLATLLFGMFHVLIDKTDIVDILYGCEIWCLTSREEKTLGVCESRVVRRIFDMSGW